MNQSEEKDPTCVIKMLDDFRSCSANSRRSILGGRPMFNFGLHPHTKPTRLNFDDSFSKSQNESGPLKRTRLEAHTDESVDSSIESSKVSESSILASPWETRRLKAELAEAKATNASLEGRLNQTRALHREMEIMFEQEKNALKQTIETDKRKINKLEKHLKTIRKREAELREELETVSNTNKQDKYSLEDKCEKLQIDNAQLKDELAEFEKTSREKLEAVERQLAQMETVAGNAKAELAEAKKLTEEITAELRDRRRELRLWETDKSKLLIATQRIKELEYEKESHLEAYNLAQAQQNKLLRITDLEKEIADLKLENKNLRQATSNTVYLEMLVEDLRGKVTQLEERERECVSLRVELGVAEGRLAEWGELVRQVLGTSPSPPSPLGLRRYIEGMQHRELQLAQDKAHADSKLKGLTDNHNEKVKELDVANNQISTLKKTVEVQTSKIRQLRKKITLITWERDDLRNLVDSCQKEVTMTNAYLECPGNSRLEALEKLVEGYQQRMAQLEADPSLAVMDAEGIGSKASSDRFEKLTAEKAALLKDKEELLKEVEELKIQMEYRSLKGDFDMRDCKILHFKMNPTSEAEKQQQSELEQCQRELLQLRERLKVMEEGQMQDLTQVVSARLTGTTSKELEDVKEKLKSSERQNQRLREVFKTTSHEFREAVYQLFGYKVDGLPKKVYRLSSLYAEGPDDHLLFKMSLEGMELCETPFSESRKDLIDLHLHHHNSIPVFLSAITVELFQRQTITSH